jgi:hypothetical protein
LFNFSNILSHLGLKKMPQISSIADLSAFIDQNSAFVSQVTLYTYVKARAGTSFPKMFENADFLTSLTISRWHIFSASVCDLSLFAAAQFRKSDHADDPTCATMSIELGSNILKSVEQTDVDPKVFTAMIRQLKARAKTADYSTHAKGDGLFSHSSDAFMAWAPVVDEFKELDEEIMRNSMHLRWIGIRREMANRLDTDRTFSNWIEQKNQTRFTG